MFSSFGCLFDLMTGIIMNLNLWIHCIFNHAVHVLDMLFDCLFLFDRRYKPTIFTLTSTSPCFRSTIHLGYFLYHCYGILWVQNRNRLFSALARTDPGYKKKYGFVFSGGLKKSLFSFPSFLRSFNWYIWGKMY